MQNPLAKYKQIEFNNIIENCVVWPSEISSADAKLAQYSKINQCNVPY